MKHLPNQSLSSCWKLGSHEGHPCFPLLWGHVQQRHGNMLTFVNPDAGVWSLRGDRKSSVVSPEGRSMRQYGMSLGCFTFTANSQV